MDTENERPPDEADQVADQVHDQVPDQVPDQPRSSSRADIMDALRSAAALDWTTIDLDLPRAGFVCCVGGEVLENKARIRCDCGRTQAIDLDGESRARCRGCGAVYRHALLVQREDQTPATPCLLIDAMLEEAGLRKAGG